MVANPSANSWVGSYILWCLVVLLPSSTQAQYRFTQWTAESGLPQSSVRGMVQTPDGYLWVATLNGLARFDGVRFQVYDKSNTPGITSSRFMAMVPGPGDELWLVSEDHNIIRVHSGQFSPVGESHGVLPHSVNAVTADHGRVWVLSDTHVAEWNRSTEQFERADFSTNDLQFHSLRWYGTGFWAQRDRRLICFNRGRLLNFMMPRGADATRITGVVVNAQDAGWVGTSDGRLARLSDKPGRLTREAQSFALHGLSKTEDWRVEIIPPRFERRIHLPIDGVDHLLQLTAIQADDEDNIWVGTEGQGLYRIQRQQSKVLSKAQGLASDNTYPVLHARSGEIWAGSWPDGVSEIRDGVVVHTFSTAQGIPGLVTSLFEDQAGVLWIGTHGGIRTLVNGRVTNPAIDLQGQSAAQVIHQAPDGAMLFGTGDGLTVTRDHVNHQLTVKDGLTTNDVRVILTDRKGDLWIGGYGGLTRLHGTQITRWTEKDGLPSDNIRSILEDFLGFIWVGTYDGGIGWFRNGKWIIFNKRKGLFDNGAFQILEDARSRFWISSNRGIYRVDRAQLAGVADGKETMITYVAYGRADGMVSVECNGGLWPAGAKDEEGRLWFPTQVGIAIIDPQKVSVISSPPRVVVEDTRIDGQLQHPAKTITLKPAQTSVEIAYTALSLTKPEQITFRYKLNGVDKDWQEVGFRRIAYYTHLPPGRYTFQVLARNSDGVSSLNTAELKLVVVPIFYRRPWFLSTALFLVLSLLTSAWRRRVKQLKQAQMRLQNFSGQLIASQESERRRIAAELHDSLGQRLIIIHNLALFLLRSKGKVRTEEEKRATMEEISGEASAAIEETRSISYALRPFQLDRLGLTRAIRALCTTAAKASDIQLSNDLANIDDAFAEDLHIHLYRIVQEGLNNVLKHSMATTAEVKILRSDHQVTISIQDDGRGMPEKPRTPEPGEGGFGISGMRERVTLLSGSMQVESDAGIGTLVTILLPIARATHHE
ncbi:ligand-binding sensor domain-containing protein [Terriglobus roseus]|uniref:Oxygen sensor histidine kinase NreB n=1 Tax=Terriglobus roseus TaxID=392734 RepID=A0A1H4JW44_9BACT|nr:sensor histidine kinase [Terriglobus roseus]SEB50520.1 Signal transduction histidine kinase [Terriglobus roseus]